MARNNNRTPPQRLVIRPLRPSDGETLGYQPKPQGGYQPTTSEGAPATPPPNSWTDFACALRSSIPAHCAAGLIRLCGVGRNRPVSNPARGCPASICHVLGLIRDAWRWDVAIGPGCIRAAQGRRVRSIRGAPGPCRQDAKAPLNRNRPCCLRAPFR